MTEDNPADPPINLPKPSKLRTISLGAAILAVPIGAGWAYRALQSSAERHDRSVEEGAQYDISALLHVDAALIRHNEVGRILTGMQSPRIMAVDPQGRLLVGGDRRVRLFSASGERLRDIELEQSPNCVAATADGQILVGIRDHIEVFAENGRRIANWPSFGTSSLLTCIAVAGNDVYVADAGRRTVLRCTRDGRVEAELAKADPSRHIPGLIVPSPHLDVAVDHDGLVWITNPGRYRLEAYNRDGEPQRFFGSSGTAIDQFLGCCNPSDIALLADGRIVTAEKGVPRVKVYLPDGRLESVVAAPDAFGENNAGLDLAVDAAGRVLVLEPGTQFVRVFAPD